MTARRTFGPLAILWGLAFLLLTVAMPATAHKEHKKKQVQAEQVMPAQGAPAAAVNPNAMHAQMGEMMEPAKEDRSKMSPIERLLDWLGRIHPVIVHFPIAFFPAALFTAIVGRRRPAFAAPVQFLVVTGGIIAPIAALLGWFDGGFELAKDDWLLQYHRWMGTIIGLWALALGIWAWRRPDANRSLAMIVALSLLTAAIVVQGWFGGAMVHGVDHMDW